MMTVFADVLTAPREGDTDTTREDILRLCRLFREDRVAKMKAKDLRVFRYAV